MNMKEIYKKVAKANNTTVEEIEREMRYAIEEAYTRKDLDENAKQRQNQVSRKGEIPTPEEIIKFCVEKAKEEKKKKRKDLHYNI